MLTRTHLVFSLFVFLILFNYLDFLNRTLFLIFVLIGTLIVDIDSRKSRVGRWILFRPFQLFVKHRGVMHTLIFGLLLSFVIYFFNPSAGFGFFAGYFLHLFLDMFTKSGIRLFWPIFNSKVGFGIRTGGLVEEILFVLLFLIDIGLIARIILY